MTRRVFELSLATAGAVALSAVPGPAAIQAVAFDGFTTFDPRPLTLAAERVFPGKGAELVNAWRTRQFEYTWLRTLTGKYADFLQVTREALVFAAAMLRLELSTEKQQLLMQAFLDFHAWPDALQALKRLKATGVRLVFLSNFTEAMLEAAVERTGLTGIFDANLSTDRVRAYKPDPRAYRMAMDTLHLKREEILFAAFGGWDAAGAKAFGYPTFWVNRLNLPAEHLGVTADASGPDLNALANFVMKE